MFSQNSIQDEQPTSQKPRKPIQISSALRKSYRDQAIVLSTIDGTKIHDYIIAVGASSTKKYKTCLKKFRMAEYASICPPKKILDELLTATNRININGSQVEVRD
ncbi:hypothetical protein JTB14_030489 [Gonioctena quinquepunctata]|nr:hypothetical protein JTB14_030489 [Gonioctena quinquepunctata]